MFKNIILSVAFGVFIVAMERWLGSKFIIDYLISNLLTIIIAVLAINATTIGIVLTKIREIMDEAKMLDGFEDTKSEMIFSIKEQIVLIIFSLLIIILIKSSALYGYSKTLDVLNVLLVSSFVFELWILYDTAKSVFVIIDYKKK